MLRKLATALYINLPGCAWSMDVKTSRATPKCHTLKGWNISVKREVLMNFSIIIKYPITALTIEYCQRRTMGEGHDEYQSHGCIMVVAGQNHEGNYSLEKWWPLMGAGCVSWTSAKEFICILTFFILSHELWLLVLYEARQWLGLTWPMVVKFMLYWNIKETKFCQALDALTIFTTRCKRMLRNDCFCDAMDIST